MSVHEVRARDKDPLAQFLGWFSVALGTAQVAAPKLMCRMVGAKDEGMAPMVMRLMGLREVTQGLGILIRPRPTFWLWSRVAGDGLDLGLLGLIAAKNPKRRARTALAVANVAGITAPDVFESLRLSRLDGPPRAAKLVRKAVTINQPRTEVEAAWLGAEDVRRKVEHARAFVRFAEAPGDRGTELIVEWRDSPTAGDIGAAVMKLAGKDLATELSDDLRLFKQRVETGEVIRSEGTPAGHALSGHLKQRAAQPLEEAVR